MKIYLAGPMRGLPEFNFPAFMKAAEELRAQGHEVFNPAERDKEQHGDFEKGNINGDEVLAAAQHGFSLREALRDDTHWISMEAEGIALLPGWQNSKGAKAERALADALHLEIIYLPGARPTSGEFDPSGRPATEPGAKLDAGKSPVFQGSFQYFPRALLAVADVSEAGAVKYTWEGWRSVPNGIARYGNAIGRHILKEKIEGLYDLQMMNDPNHPVMVLHAAQVAWNALARLDLMLVELEKQ